MPTLEWLPRGGTRPKLFRAVASLNIISAAHAPNSTREAAHLVALDGLPVDLVVQPRRPNLGGVHNAINHLAYLAEIMYGIRTLSGVKTQILVAVARKNPWGFGAVSKHIKWTVVSPIMLTYEHFSVQKLFHREGPKTPGGFPIMYAKWLMVTENYR